MSSAEAGQHAALDPDRLNAAVEASILTRSQADSLAAFWVGSDAETEREAVIQHADREEVRFVRGFHDIFISIGITMFLVGLCYFLSTFTGTATVAIVGAAAVWLFSEIFVKRMRLALPAFILSVAFTPFFFVALGALFVEGAQSLTGMEDMLSDADTWSAADKDGSVVFILPALITIAGACLHYFRFRVPVGMASITGSVILLAAFSLDTIFPDLLSYHFLWFSLVAGIATLGLAMRFDSCDLMRTTVNSDKAFWLHLMAAPLIVHSVLQLMVGLDGMADSNMAWIVIAFVLALGVMAIVIDRRAFLVSGLGYFGVALGTLLAKTEVAEGATIAFTLLVLGLFVLLVGSAWRRVRRLLLTPLKNTVVMQYVPPVE